MTLPGHTHCSFENHYPRRSFKHFFRFRNARLARKRRYVFVWHTRYPRIDALHDWFMDWYQGYFERKITRFPFIAHDYLVHQRVCSVLLSIWSSDHTAISKKYFEEALADSERNQWRRSAHPSRIFNWCLVYVNPTTGFRPLSTN